MDVLTPAERRAAAMVVLLLVLGGAWDLWRATRPLPVESPAETGASVPAASAEGAAGEAGAGGAATAPRDSQPVARLDLNRATARDLDRLPGIGPVLAGRIVEYRERYGAYTRIEDLLAVRGIGPRLFARLAPHVAVAPPPRVAQPPYKEGSPGSGGTPPGVQSAAGARRVRADSTSVLHGASR